jgi:hypothetical protein
MKRYNGGSMVEGGYYWNTGAWEITTVKGAEGKLPGERSATFVRVPLPVLFVVAPAMGGAFALFLPFIGFAMPFYALGRRLFRPAETAARHAAR